MSHKTILGGFAAAAVGLTMLGGALPASAATTTSFAPAGQSSHDDHHRDRDKNKCWDVDFDRHRGHWDVSWRDKDGKHTEHARTYRDAVDELKDHCDRFDNGHHWGDRDDHRHGDRDRDDHRHGDRDRDDHRHGDRDRDDHRHGDRDRDDHRHGDRDRDDHRHDGDRHRDGDRHHDDKKDDHGDKKWDDD